jgi:GAF domain-containing protein
MTPRRRQWRVPTPAAPIDTTAEADLALVRDLAHALLRAERAEEAFQFALDRTCPVVGATLGSVYMLEGASELMRLVAAHAWPERWRPWLGEMRVRMGFGPSGEAAAERRVIEVPDVSADAGLEDWQEVAGELGFRALVALPLVIGDTAVGAATFYFKEPGVPPARVRHLLRASADLMAAMAAQEALRERVRHAEAALEEQRPPDAPRIPDSGPTRE